MRATERLTEQPQSPREGKFVLAINEYVKRTEPAVRKDIQSIQKKVLIVD